MMDATTIKVHERTKQELDQFREYKNESYEEVIKKMIYIAKNVRTQPELSKEAVTAIENARTRVKTGNFVTEEDAKKRLGF
jgi:predicted transcriptional regulator